MSGYASSTAVASYLAHTLVRPKANLYVHASTKSAQEISDVQLLFHALVYSNKEYFNAHTVKATCNTLQNVLQCIRKFLCKTVWVIEFHTTVGYVVQLQRVN